VIKNKYISFSIQLLLSSLTTL